MNTELQKINNNNIPAVINNQGLVILTALASPMVNEVDPYELFNVLNKAIAKSYVDTGYKAPDAKSDIERGLYENMVNELVVYIRVKLATYRLDEIPIAIGNGSCGEYGDFTGLNKKSYIQFLIGYKNSEDRARKLAEHNAQMAAVKDPPTLTEQFLTAKNNALLAYEAFKNKQSIPRLGGPVYDFINSLGLINYDKETKLIIFSQATEIVIAYNHSQKATSNFFERQQLSNLITAFRLGPDPDSKEHKLIVAVAKGLTLDKYFEDSIADNINLDTLVESQRKLFIELNQPKTEDAK